VSSWLGALRSAAHSRIPESLDRRSEICADAGPGASYLRPRDSMTDQLRALSLEAALTVNDLEASVTWYTSILGFAMDRRHEREGHLIAVSLRAGAVRLLLTQDDGAKGRDRDKGEGFSLQITTRQDVDALAARIKENGWTLDTEPFSMPHARAFRLRDPDGFRITVSTPPAV